MNLFSGSLVALVTPMALDEGLDLTAWKRLIEFHITNGTAGIVVGGTTGESSTLSEEELRELTLVALAQSRGRIQVIVGAGTSSTQGTMERVEWLSELQIDGVLVVTPAYNRPTQEGLFRHYEAVAAVSQVPVLAYNVPGRTAVDMLPSTVRRIAQLPNMAGIKEAVAGVERIRELFNHVPGHFAILSGDDATCREAMLAGAHGVISVTANVAPYAMAKMVKEAIEGNEAGAAGIDKTLAALHTDLFLEANPIPTKWALTRMGLIGPALRLPLTQLSEDLRPRVEQALIQAKVL